MINRGRHPERFLTTILFTDIVGSTDLAVKLGDREWRRVVAAHHAVVRRALRRFGGREIDTAGDGFFASFDQPAQAVRAADAIVAGVAQLGLSVRAGVHTGEAEVMGPKVGGIAVHIAARVVAEAAPGEVLVSSTVRDLVPGSGLAFTDRGSHALKGVPSEWHLYALEREAPADTSQAGAAAAVAAATPESHRRRNAALLALGAVAVASAFVAVLVVVGVLGRAPVGPSLPPGPNTVVALDASTGKVVDVRSVPAGPVAVAAGSGRLWVAALDAGVLADLPSAAAGSDRLIGRIGRPTALAFGGGNLWVADAYAQTVTIVDAGSGNVLRRLDRLPARQIAYGSNSAWLADDLADRLVRLDRQSGDVVASIALDAGTYPTAVTVSGNGVWVSNEGKSTVARIDPTANSVVAAAIPLRATPDGIAASVNDVWIISRGSDVLFRIDSRTNAVAATTAVCDQPTSVATDGESDTVWVGCAGTREVSHLAHDGTVLSTTSVGGEPTALTAISGRVYVTVRRP